ncbi:MAG: hypothetical protein ABI539_11115 [Acidobacteriota bacterium]
MNSEELERSLRTEFETYLKGVMSELRRDITEFQKNFESEFDKHKAQVDAAFGSLAARFETEAKFDQAFTETVTEHLKLARDEGAELAATAFGEAEKLQEATQPVAAASYDKLRDAINDISSKTSQASILTSLVEHAAEYTPRGAFFIAKNDHFVGWKVFGREGERDDASVRDVHFPMSAETILSASVAGPGTQESKFGGFSDDAMFLEPLNFGRPDRMIAIPLTARGRGVAVLYADYGTEGVNLNVEAIETLVRVAGLTVELLASSHAPKPQADRVETQPAVEPQTEPKRSENVESAVFVPVAESSSEPAAVEVPVEEVDEYTGHVSVEEPPYAESHAETEPAESFEAVDDASVRHELQPEAVEETVEYFEPVQETAPTVDTSHPSDFEFETASSYEPLRPIETVEGTAPAVSGVSFQQVHEPSVEVAGAQPSRVRLSDRNVDLPIEVSEEERRLHNDARRFARLLVSEIKLYNEQKVNEGREAADLYDRLREAIDRSREMYEKRVKPSVASKFDYFHYELVNSLAEGQDSKLGANYPGSVV